MDLEKRMTSIEDGENRAVRGFLLGLEVGIKSSNDMKQHMTNYGTPFWPEWVDTDPKLHMSKAAKQAWLRHLFALEDPKLQWCDECGEGYVNFCRGNVEQCPMEPKYG